MEDGVNRGRVAFALRKPWIQCKLGRQMRELRGNIGPVPVEMLQRGTLGTGHGLARERGAKGQWARDPHPAWQEGRPETSKSKSAFCFYFVWETNASWLSWNVHVFKKSTHTEMN